MINQTKDVKQELFDKRIEYGRFNIVDCTDQENAMYADMKNNREALPENVRQYKNTNTDQYVDKFYYLKESKLTDSEWQEYLRYVELNRMNTIENCIIFFTVLTIIIFILGFIIFVNS